MTGVKGGIALDDHLQAVLRAGVPGAVAVAAGPGFSWEGAAGVADAETGAGLTTEHRFRIGSVTKLLVATVVLQLVGEGALALDDDVGPIAEGVTLRQLLNHTERSSRLLRRHRLGAGAVPEGPDVSPGFDASCCARARARQAAALCTGDRLDVLGRQLPRPWADRRRSDGRHSSRGAEAKDLRAARPREQLTCRMASRPTVLLADTSPRAIRCFRSPARASWT